MGQELDKSHYDKLFNETQSYKDSYKTSRYAEGWGKSISWLEATQNKGIRILDIGCGTGQFAEMLLDNGFSSYRGFDFSDVAIDIAKKRIPLWGDNFQVGDIFTTDALDKYKYDVVCLFEVLEHINNDIACLSKVRAGATVLLSVPNFWDPAHVRVFASMDEVIERYQSVIQIQDKFEIVRSQAKWFYIKGVKRKNVSK
jgi:2-polyprenyl-3-methyl-5-hydroxy-6-metoxy-1,4-benzoquinol methylase